MTDVDFGDTLDQLRVCSVLLLFAGLRALRCFVILPIHGKVDFDRAGPSTAIVPAR